MFVNHDDRVPKYTFFPTDEYIMSYQVQQTDGVIEIRITGPTSKHEVFRAFLDIERLDPEGELADVWWFSEESQIPLADFHEIAIAAHKVQPTRPRCDKTALVAVDQLQYAQMELYRLEASFLPRDIRVFMCREEAMAWIRGVKPAKE